MTTETRTTVIYEAPHHLKATLLELYNALGDRKITLCRELTKLHETIQQFTLETAIDYYSQNAPKGEYPSDEAVALVDEELSSILPNRYA